MCRGPQLPGGSWSKSGGGDKRVLIMSAAVRGWLQRVMLQKKEQKPSNKKKLKTPGEEGGGRVWEFCTAAGEKKGSSEVETGKLGWRTGVGGW